MKALVVGKKTPHTERLIAALKAKNAAVLEIAGADDLAPMSGEAWRRHFELVVMSGEVAEPNVALFKVRKALYNMPFAVLMGHDMEEAEALKCGFGALLLDDFAEDELDELCRRAQTLDTLSVRLNDAQDYPSAGGVISKSAFNQLYRAALDRGGRYAEKTYTLFMRIANADDVRIDDGPDKLAMVGAALAARIANTRRQSDVLAQTGQYEYALLLLRPQTEREPVDATLRFAGDLQEIERAIGHHIGDIEIALTLIELPTGRQCHKETVRLAGAGMAA